MQVVILCGGKGTRIREVSEGVIPKPMVTIGERPILWHIMNYYAQFGHNDFILCLGYQSWKIKEYFLNYQAMTSDVTLKLGEPTWNYHTSSSEADWSVTLAETGQETMTAGRVKCIEHYLRDDDIMLTYGDGVADVDLNKLLHFHKKHGRKLTLTGVIPPGRFGELGISGDEVTQMQEKPADSSRFINGGFMVMKRSFIDHYLDGEIDNVMLEREPFEQAANDGQMMVWKHHGFWQCMDTFRDWKYLNELWVQNKAPWSISS